MMERNGWTYLEYEMDETMIQYMNHYPLTSQFDRWHGSLWKILKENYLGDTGGVAIDCGASYGWFTIPMSQHFDTVHSFEMRKDVLFCLEQNLEYCDINNVEIWNNAVSSVDDEIVGYDKDNWATGVTRVDPTKTNMRTKSIDSLELDDVRFMKINIEGGEYDALCGASLTIDRCRPVIMFEEHTRRTEENYLHRQKLFDFMRRYDYKFADAVQNDFIFTP